MMSALGTLLVVQSSSPAQAVAFISMALFCVHFAGTSAWGLVQVMVSETKVASIAGIQNFGSFVFASFAPIVTGWVVDTILSLQSCLDKRAAKGGVSPQQVAQAIAFAQARLG